MIIELSFHLFEYVPDANNDRQLHQPLRTQYTITDISQLTDRAMRKLWCRLEHELRSKHVPQFATFSGYIAVYFNIVSSTAYNDGPIAPVFLSPSLPTHEPVYALQAALRERVLPCELITLRAKH